MDAVPSVKGCINALTSELSGGLSGFEAKYERFSELTGWRSICEPPVVGMHAASSPVVGRRVLLAAARVKVLGPNGVSMYRTLLDQVAESSFVSESIVQRLGLPKQHACVELLGLGSIAAGSARSKTLLVQRSNVDPHLKLEVDALILPKVTSNLPSHNLGDLDSQ